MSTSAGPNSLGERLRELLAERNITHLEFARKVPMASAQLYQIFKGAGFPSEKRLKRFCRILGLTSEEEGELFTLLALGKAKGATKQYIEELRRAEPGTAHLSDNLRAVTGPVAGVPVFAINAGDEMAFDDAGYPVGVSDSYISVPGLSDPHAFAAVVRGDSMAPELEAGDIAVFSPVETSQDGDVCFVRAGDETVTMKQVFFGERELRLVAFNHEYPERRIPRAEDVRVWPLWGVFKVRRRDR